jgi:type I restriction-modification system DNA methylase subunit
MDMDSEEIKKNISNLVEKYNKLKAENKINKFNEAQTRNEFIEPLFEFLGWDMRNLRIEGEVITEEQVSKGRVDLAFRINGIPKFFLEAKSMKVDLDNQDYAKQAIKYSWNKGVDYAVLTDFESVKIFNAQTKSKSLLDKLIFEIHCKDYISDFDRLNLLSKESFEDNALDTYAEKYGKKSEKLTVNEKLFSDLKRAREVLTDSFGQWNKNLDKETLDEGVQKILDRLIFIRVLEDRELESPILQPLIRNWEKGDGQVQIFHQLIEKFRDLDEHYNSNLFTPHACEKWEEYDLSVKRAIEMLYGDEIHEYDFKNIPADILGGVYESYLGYIAQNPIEIDTQGKSGKLLKIESKKDLNLKSRKKRKEQGIYYTPKFIVDYIVKNTLGEKLKEIKSVNELNKIKVLDPACGSGSFLTRALEELNKKYKDFGYLGDQGTKSQILLQNIHGVDLDAQAVELARLNLLIDALDKKEKLPNLTENIRIGNSLISGGERELEKYFGKDWKEKKPFNWQEEFKGVFAQGGFDVIIGNPPYVNIANIKDANEREWLKDKYETAKNKSDLYSFFTEKATKLLKEDGILGFIFSNSWLGTDSFSEFRKYLIENTTIFELVRLPAGVFKDALVTTILIFIKNKKPKENQEIKLMEFKEGKLQEIGKLRYEKIKANPDCRISFGEEINFNTPVISLGTVAKLSMGIKTSDNTKFILDDKKDEDTLPILRGKDVGRYNYNYANKWIWYKPDLMMKKVGAGPRKREYFETPKLLFREITGGGIIATFDTNNYFTNNKIHVLYSLENYDLRFILAVANSKLINTWVRHAFNNSFQVEINQLEKIPIPKIDFSDPREKAKHNELVDLADKMLKLNKDLQVAPENSDKWNDIKKEIEKTDKKIDQKVYALYGLTEEEIRVVEGK